MRQQYWTSEESHIHLAEVAGYTAYISTTLGWGDGDMMQRPHARSRG